MRNMPASKPHLWFSVKDGFPSFPPLLAGEEAKREKIEYSNTYGKKMRLWPDFTKETGFPPHILLIHPFAEFSTMLSTEFG